MWAWRSVFIRALGFDCANISCVYRLSVFAHLSCAIMSFVVRRYSSFSPLGRNTSHTFVFRAKPFILEVRERLSLIFPCLSCSKFYVDPWIRAWSVIVKSLTSYYLNPYWS
ncbi:unnamed protein product [Somion occarium]|uniref:Secreted protein n=1 Tax=Somion occarium TaxID=3059160 RepID=A0ABP1CUP8_9APHY